MKVAPTRRTRSRPPGGAEDLPTLKDIEEAESRIRAYIAPTPLEASASLSRDLGREVFLKLETFQPIRVFKIRGALNKLLSLGDSSLRRGVVTASSGNHGFAIAYASRMFGTKAVICVPQNVNPQKVAAIEEQGAEVVKAGPGYDAAYKNAVGIARRRGLTFVHAFNDREVIAGQGTCGLEMARQSKGALDAAVVAIGGGGLISGISIALKGSIEGVKVYGAETKAIPSMYESLREGKRVLVEPKATIADGMQAAIPGELTFAAATKYVDRVGLVDDEQLKEAIYDLLVKARVMAEPAGASPLAAIRRPLKDAAGERVALVVSGGNISLDLLKEILNRARP